MDPAEGSELVVPQHVAIIMDGNGRWALQRGLPRMAGHEAGAESVRETVRQAGRLGVGFLTLYSFSTENWARPDEEVQALMALLARYLRDEQDELVENRVRLHAIGELGRLPAPVRVLLDQAMALTADHDGLCLTLALSYGSRDEIVAVMRDVASAVQRGELEPGSIDAAAVESRLYTAGLPDPDLLIRTSGEMRLSNFLLWQLAYSELYVTDVLWPDFRREHLLQALRHYGRRQRRFGRTEAQVGART